MYGDQFDLKPVDYLQFEHTRHESPKYAGSGTVTYYCYTITCHYCGNKLAEGARITFVYRPNEDSDLYYHLQCRINPDDLVGWGCV